MPLKAKGSGAEVHAEGPFLKWQNRSGKAAKALRERGDHRPPTEWERGSCSSDLAWVRMSVTAAKPPHIEEQTQGRDSDEERWQTGCDAAVCVAVHTGRAGRAGERAGRRSPPGNPTSGHCPPRRHSSYGFHLQESFCQKERGDPDGGPAQTHSCPGLWLQGVPEPGARTGGQQRQQLCLVRPCK